ncbi:MAG: hypothetical protein WBZ36_29010, partial [Candidatus Nitrosopolaris sp.]
RNFKFTANVWAVPEGTILFPNEPIIRVEAPIIEAQIIETYILSMIYQSIANSYSSKREVHYRVWFKARPWA